MAQQFQGQFGYQTVQFIKTEPLGTGSYGAVYKAILDDLPCAGKILHPTLFQSNDPGAMTVMKRFQQECSFLSAIRHPNIVQFLGSFQDSETRLPVLLMELMDASLTQFLERSQEPLFFHTQVNVCHDIALALAYLHSKNIIHRDLSSNNVLLIGAGNRAKITDFGMAKISGVNRSTMTKCPGTEVYMSPETLDDSPNYTKKLDCFSFGVLGIQILTREFPAPAPRTKRIKHPQSPTGNIEMPVLETERRKSHLDLIHPAHPLLPIAIDCLIYEAKGRPSAQELCNCLAALKKAPQYCVSAQTEAQKIRKLEKRIKNKLKLIDKLQQDLKQQLQYTGRQARQIQDLQHCLQVSDDQVQQKDAEIAARKEEIQQLVQQIQHTQQKLQESGSQVQHKELVIATREQQIWRLKQEHKQVTWDKDHHVRDLERQLAASQRLIASTNKIKQTLMHKEKLVQQLQQRNIIIMGLFIAFICIMIYYL